MLLTAVGRLRFWRRGITTCRCQECLLLTWLKMQATLTCMCHWRPAIWPHAGVKLLLMRRLPGLVNTGLFGSHKSRWTYCLPRACAQCFPHSRDCTVTHQLDSVVPVASTASRIMHAILLHLNLAVCSGDKTSSAYTNRPSAYCSCYFLGYVCSSLYYETVAKAALLHVADALNMSRPCIWL